jgi:hypothetical protein
MRPAEEALFEVVQRVFEDGRISASDRLAMVSVYGRGGLTVGEVKEVYRAFLRKTWGNVIDDELLTHEERVILVRIVTALRLPWECAPFPDELEELGIAI